MRTSYVQPGHWFGQVTQLGLLGLTQPHGPSWTQSKKESEIGGVLVYLFYGLYFYIVEIQIWY
jgi:hypothetical protein